MRGSPPSLGGSHTHAHARAAQHTWFFSGSSRAARLAAQRERAHAYEALREAQAILNGERRLERKRRAYMHGTHWGCDP
eukprot:scaffold3189_cov138-Isochrysis_galbana.AAC.2